MKARARKKSNEVTVVVKRKGNEFGIGAVMMKIKRSA